MHNQIKEIYNPVALSEDMSSLFVKIDDGQTTSQIDSKINGGKSNLSIEIADSNCEKENQDTNSGEKSSKAEKRKEFQLRRKILDLEEEETALNVRLLESHKNFEIATFKTN